MDVLLIIFRYISEERKINIHSNSTRQKKRKNSVNWRQEMIVGMVYICILTCGVYNIYVVPIRSRLLLCSVEDVTRLAVSSLGAHSFACEKNKKRSQVFPAQDT